MKNRRDREFERRRQRSRRAAGVTPPIVNLKHKKSRRVVTRPPSSSHLSVRPTSKVAWWVLGGLGFLAILPVLGVRGPVSEENLINFPPPEPYRALGGQEALVTVVNASPESLQLVLRGSNGAETISLPPCKDCSYETTRPEKCEKGNPQTITLQPGIYEARGDFFGLGRPFQSTWTLSPGWEHYQCLFLTDDIAR